MEFVVILLIFVGVPVFLVIAYARRGNFKENNEVFSQAGVTVNYSSGKIKINKYEYDVGQVKSLQWSSGGGRYGNLSVAIIELEDMKKPTHQIDFVRSTDASDFVNRLTIAIKKAGGTILD